MEKDDSIKNIEQCFNTTNHCFCSILNNIVNDNDDKSKESEELAKELMNNFNLINQELSQMKASVFDISKGNTSNLPNQTIIIPNDCALKISKSIENDSKVIENIVTEQNKYRKYYFEILENYAKSYVDNGN